VALMISPVGARSIMTTSGAQAVTAPASKAAGRSLDTRRQTSVTSAALFWISMLRSSSAFQGVGPFDSGKMPAQIERASSPKSNTREDGRARNNAREQWVTVLVMEMRVERVLHLKRGNEGSAGIAPANTHVQCRKSTAARTHRIVRHIEEL